MPLVPLHLIWKPVHGLVTPIFSWDYRQGAFICSNPSHCNSRPDVNSIIMFLSSSQICLSDLYVKQEEFQYGTFAKKEEKTPTLYKKGFSPLMWRGLCSFWESSFLDLLNVFFTSNYIGEASSEMKTIGSSWVESYWGTHMKSRYYTTLISLGNTLTEIKHNLEINTAKNNHGEQILMWNVFACFLEKTPHFKKNPK